jgi:hypothetical protein
MAAAHTISIIGHPEGWASIRATHPSQLARGFSEGVDFVKHYSKGAAQLKVNRRGSVARSGLTDSPPNRGRGVT